MIQKTKNQINETNKTPTHKTKSISKLCIPVVYKQTESDLTEPHHIYTLIFNGLVLKFWKGNCSYPRHSGSLFGKPSEVEENKWPITAPL